MDGNRGSEFIFAAGSSHFLRLAANREVDMALQLGEAQKSSSLLKPIDTMHKLNNRELGGLERELLDKSSKYHEAVPKASQKIGIPKTTADINADSLMRSTFVRNAVNAAGINLANESCRSIIGFSWGAEGPSISRGKHYG
ncbi:uncharacterized protein BKA55DRAFT_679885 [Fusarium redolens]|uniref:Uncharacterized protein n=1 Tax=Fusarium redolens TaxID=48865 RepID=A0A9P9GA61_FUSRE|nr:uncharacterized protein BKA55DRAFT_679885 [Fusarium redolens]KAH7233977.1 hypothetical protein BKA55DRAFT_679885 [Fusarium redolens]